MYKQVIALSIILEVVAVMLLGNVAWAQATTSNYSNQSILGSAMQVVGCTQTFADSVMGSIINSSSHFSYLNSNLTTLNSEYATLQTLAANGNLVPFAKYIYGPYYTTYGQLYFSARGALISGNLTTAQKITLLKQIIQEKNALSSCRVAALQSIATVRIGSYEKILNVYSSQTANLSAKGVNTSNMTALLQSAQTAILVPLQNADNSSNSTTLQYALEEYCMFDGCPVGMNYHLDAKFGIAKLQAVINKLKTLPISSNSTALVKAQVSLNNATSELNSVGTRIYLNNQQTQIWVNINAAYTDLAGILNTTKTSG